MHEVPNAPKVHVSESGMEAIREALRERGVIGPISAPAVTSSATWIQALKSTAFDLVNPRPEMVDWDTIATVCARLPRFGGHTDPDDRPILSVAQHQYEGAKAILRDTGRKDWAAAFAIHDAHEAYMGDIVTPVVEALCELADDDSDLMIAGRKAGAVVKRAVSELKRRLDSAIYLAAGFPATFDEQTWAVVKSYDRRMLVTEREARMAPPPRKWSVQAEPVKGVDLSPWVGSVMAIRYRRLLRELLNR